MTASEIEYPRTTDPTLDHEHHHHQISLEISDDFIPSQTTNHIYMIDITSSEEEFQPNVASSLPKSEEIESDFPATHKRTKTRRKNSSLKPRNACRSHSYHSSIPDGRDGALQRAKAFKAQNPFFIVTMRWSYVNNTIWLYHSDVVRGTSEPIRPMQPFGFQMEELGPSSTEWEQEVQISLLVGENLRKIILWK